MHRCVWSGFTGASNSTCGEVFDVWLWPCGSWLLCKRQGICCWVTQYQPYMSVHEAVTHFMCAFMCM